MEDKISKLELAKATYKEFANEFKTVLMATVDENGYPNASYSPYVKYDDDFYKVTRYFSRLSKSILSSSLNGVKMVYTQPSNLALTSSNMHSPLFPSRDINSTHFSHNVIK